MIRSVRRLLVALASSAALCLAAGGILVSTAQASATPCPSLTVSQPFAQWGDQSDYALVPGGDFETPQWTLQNGAAIVPGSEPYAATGTPGSSSLSLPAGGAASSPTICLDASEPTLRFFIAGSGSVLVQVTDGNISIPVGVVNGPGGWQPSPVVMTGSKLLGRIGGGTASVSIRLTALSGQPQVDDVFIDPWIRG